MSLAESNAMAERLVRKFEGFRSAPYQDSAGIWTIGYGTTHINGQPVTADTPPCSQDQADAYLLADLAWAQRVVDSRTQVALQTYERAALISFAYNVGAGAFESSTLLKLLNRGQRAAAAAQFTQWDHAGGQVVQGLLNRREQERDVFLGKVSV